MNKLDVIDAKIIKGTLQGKTAQQLGKELYPTQKPLSARVSVSKRLRKVTVQTSLQAALLKHDLTLDKALRPIKDALKATKMEKVRVSPTEWEWQDTGLPDLTLRLKASDRIIALLGLEKQGQDNSSTSLSDKDMHALATNSDEVELQKIVFRND